MFIYIVWTLSPKPFSTLSKDKGVSPAPNVIGCSKLSTNPKGAVVIVGYSPETGFFLKSSLKGSVLKGAKLPAATPPVFSFNIMLLISCIMPVVDDSQKISKRLCTGSVSYTAKYCKPGLVTLDILILSPWLTTMLSLTVILAGLVNTIVLPVVTTAVWLTIIWVLTVGFVDPNIISVITVPSATPDCPERLDTTSPINTWVIPVPKLGPNSITVLEEPAAVIPLTPVPGPW